MRWKGETQIQWMARMKNWRPWFAWHPVQIEGGDWVWLSYVERKVSHYNGQWMALDRKWVYRSIDKDVKQ